MKIVLKDVNYRVDFNKPNYNRVDLENEKGLENLILVGDEDVFLSLKAYQWNVQNTVSVLVSEQSGLFIGEKALVCLEVVLFDPFDLDLLELSYEMKVLFSVIVVFQKVEVETIVLVFFDNLKRTIL